MREPQSCLPLLPSLAAESSLASVRILQESSWPVPVSCPSQLPPGGVGTYDKIKTIHWSLPLIPDTVLLTLIIS